MKKARIVVALGIVLLVAAVLLKFGPDFGTGRGRLGVDLQVDERVLENGLTIAMVEDHSVPVISYQTWFRVGSVDEHPGITGISHLFEHLMFKGTEKYGPKEFFRQLEARGAEVNAFTSRDYTGYYENLTPELLEKVIDMEADRLANLKLDEKALQTERNVVFEERRLRTDNSPSGRMQEALWGLAYRVHPYQWPVIGYPEDLLRISAEDLQAYFKKHYQPSNATVVVVGDFDTERTFGLIRKAYGKIPSGKRPERAFDDEPEQNEERRLRIYDHVASERFVHGYHITSADDEDSYALDVLSNILFEGSSSRAYRRLVEEMNIALGVNGTAYTPAYKGLFSISASMKGKIPATEGEKALWDVISEVQENGVTEEEISIAVKQLTVELVDSVRTPHGLAHLIGVVKSVLGDIEEFNQSLEKYLGVTRGDVQRVARKYLRPNNRTVVILAPIESKPKEAEVAK